VFEEPPGSYDICPVCFWEDDAVQLRWPDMAGGANHPSLLEAQRTYGALGAIEARLVEHTRPPLDDEPVEAGWRPIDPSVDTFEPWDGEGHRRWPDDMTTLYWWRPTFWGLGPA
jgi:hypothetical protein